MNFLFITMTFITHFLTTVKNTILHIILHIISFFNKEKVSTKIRWKEDIQDVYYTYSKEEYDRKSFKPFLFHRNFFK